MSSPPPPPAAGSANSTPPPSAATAAPRAMPLYPRPPQANAHAHQHQYPQHNLYPPPTKSTEETPALAFAEQAQRYNRQFQGILDRITPYSLYRWCGTGALLVLFALRVVLGGGWYIVAYGLSIFLLNIFLAFLQPKFDPSLEQDLTSDSIEEGGTAGTLDPSVSTDFNVTGKLLNLVGVSKASLGADDGEGEEEFRPFIRRLPEFKFWLQATRATLISIGLTITRASDVPVYWPILLIYFLTLFGLTMRRQLRHMIKYKYIPFDLGRKAKYGGKK